MNNILSSIKKGLLNSVYNTWFNDEHLKNALDLIIFTDLVIEICFNDEQFSKELTPIEVIFERSSICV